jgi:hypothetical protein
MSAVDSEPPPGQPAPEPEKREAGAPAHVDLAAEIERARARVAASLHTLGDEVSRRGDWRAWIRARPTLALTGALVLGFLWGGGGGPPRSNT